MMKKLMMTAAALVFLGTATMAQDTKSSMQATPDAAVQQRMSESVRLTSSTLKDTRVMLEQQVVAINAEMASATGEGLDKLTIKRDQLVEYQGQLDQMLDLVNRSSAEDWDKVQIKAEAVNNEIREAIQKSK
jgi:hypothetical protein